MSANSGAASVVAIDGGEWRACADRRLVTALPSLRVLHRHSGGAAAAEARLSTSPTSPPLLLRLEDGTETPGLGLIGLRPGRTTVGRLFAIDCDEPDGGIFIEPLPPPTADSFPEFKDDGDDAAEASELYVNGFEVPSAPRSPLQPGSLIVCGRCLFLLCGCSSSCRSGAAAASPSRYLAGHTEVATLHRENSDLRARVRDLLEAADRADGVAVRVSAALGRLEAALFGGGGAGCAAAQLQQLQLQRNDSCSAALPLCGGSSSSSGKVAAASAVGRIGVSGWAGQAVTHAVLLHPPEVHRSTAVTASLLPRCQQQQKEQQEQLLQQLARRQQHNQFLMGVAADVSDKLVAALGDINCGCDQQWLFDRLCDLVSEIGWALAMPD